MAKGLGKGIEAFFHNLEAQEEEVVKEIELRQLRPNPYQPRKYFSEQSIQELKDSIIEHGILQPIIARKSIKGYEIVAGERRYRAAKEAKLQAVPVVVREFTEQQMMELALLENLQREDLTPIEEAKAYEKLMQELNLTQEQLAQRVGKSRPHIANHVRLLSLPEKIQDAISRQVISMGHGRALLGLKKKEQLDKLVEQIKEEDLSVRQLEKLIQQLNEHVPRETRKPKKQKNVFIQEQESLLRDYFGTAVTIKESKNKGKIEIKFVNEQDLERILDLLKRT
ncbi:ParB/RepB/Spo0J family partition protein [Ectobacillus antri]|uniref:ParB/RepB/Spo0J family partition protein n=1 Tax=Ectobacillus antri TaxID=2486280 RepID=A0ABT6H8P7_9BACI|nr:ParB/RepB/Spo0J family partition protein [Ectobacillus antri]MDG4657559.1 ParB/RepB/Spo0J family partition protein [Ectobacillus antri]MDG5755163.1 ParB/RepB/Spo0J family partition protein [Ectobacillus antri]